MGEAGGREHRAEEADEDVAVNAIGSWAATTGLSEAARRAVTGLLSGCVNVAMQDIDYGAPREDHRFPPRLRALPTGRPFPVDLCFINVNELQELPEEFLDGSAYAIGYWYWELPTMSAEVERQVGRVDEIWVASAFTRDAFRRYTDAPITVIPCVVEPVADPKISRADFGIDERSLVYLFNFDAHSTLARKNPLGVIEAFRRAFSPAERGRDAMLVLKSINLERLGEAANLVREEVESVRGLLIEDDLPARSMAALTRSCDVYVSLHRAEGFGLGMAEAMYFEKPVVATAYSGNLEFTTALSSLLVGYGVRPITEGELRFNPGVETVYTPGALWAEPDLAQAASFLRALARSPDLRDRIGRRAGALIRARFSTEAVGRAARDRLVQIEQLRRAPGFLPRRRSPSKHGVPTSCEKIE